MPTLNSPEIQLSEATLGRWVGVGIKSLRNGEPVYVGTGLVYEVHELCVYVALIADTRETPHIPGEGTCIMKEAIDDGTNTLFEVEEDEKAALKKKILEWIESEGKYLKLIAKALEAP